jgi:lysyl-tRNA synthetase class 2
MERDPAGWPPGATIATLRRRATLLRRIRTFFEARNVLEVDTPQLCPVTVTDPLLDSIPAQPFHDGVTWYLQTSPEFAMKRLLAAGSGPIYQMAKAFRRAEHGQRHNPEFTMLEWYRPGFSTAQLIEEVAALALAVVGTRALHHDSYRAVFRRETGVDPYAAPTALLRERAQTLAADVSGWERDTLLDLLFSACVEPRLGHHSLQFVDGFPAARAALARTTRDAQGTLVADRFELFIDGLEIANGYNELCDAVELRRRMHADNAQRARLGLAEVAVDECLLAAMTAGLPQSAGVALGVDRLLMIALGAARLDQVLAFDAARA